MPWPDERLTDYIPHMPVKSQDLIKLQDAVSGMHHGTQRFWRSLNNHALVDTANGAWSFFAQTGVLLTFAAGTADPPLPEAYIDLDCSEGAIIRRFGGRVVAESLTSFIQVALIRVRDGVATPIATVTNDETSHNTWTTVASDIIDEVVQDGDAYRIRLTPAGDGESDRVCTSVFLETRRG